MSIPRYLSPLLSLRLFQKNWINPMHVIHEANIDIYKYIWVVSKSGTPNTLLEMIHFYEFSASNSKDTNFHHNSQEFPESSDFLNSWEFVKKYVKNTFCSPQSPTHPNTSKRSQPEWLECCQSSFRPRKRIFFPTMRIHRFVRPWYRP